MSVLPAPRLRIFIVGFPRSGTTLLREILNAHPRVAITPETHFLGRFGGGRGEVEGMMETPSWERLVRRLAAVIHLREAGLDPDELVARAEGVPRTPSGALRLVVDGWAAHHGAEVGGEKTPVHQVHMPLLQEWFPDARFIHIVRDPRAVASSWRSLPWSHGSVGADAVEWRRRHLRALADRTSIRGLLEVRYEDLVRDTEAVARRLCEFLDLDFSPAMLRHAEDSHGGGPAAPPGEPWKWRVREAVTSERIDAWRDDLGRRQVWTVEAVAGSLLGRYGYRPATPAPLRFALRIPLGIAARLDRRARGTLRRLRPHPRPLDPPRVVLSDAAGPVPNPYGRLLADAVEDADPLWAVERFRPRKLFRPRAPALWHMHWPESGVSQRSTPGAVRDALTFALALAGARLRRIPVVWTVHNAEAHEERRRWLSEPVMRAFVRRLDGWMSLSEAGARVAEQRHPRLRRLPRAVVPLGHFRDWYGEPPGREETREGLGFDERTRLLLFLGHIRPYKRVPALLSAFSRTRGAGLHLLVAGRPDHPEEGRAVEGAVGSPARTTLRLGHVPEADVPSLLAAADGFVLPAERLLNSASALLALSYGVPVLVPDTPVMRELRSTLGTDAVHLLEGEISAEDLERFGASLDVDRAAIAARVREVHDWRGIGEKTADLYRVVLERKREGKAPILPDSATSVGGGP